MSKYIRGIGKASRFAVPMGDKVVKCTACYHHCILEPGHRGICGIRHNYKGKLFSLVDQRPCSTALDPIEKKPLYHFYPGTRIYSIGTVGCNMRCSFCQNWSISQTPKGSRLDLEDVNRKLQAIRLSPEDAVRQAKRAGCNSIAYTYNEPTIFADFIYDTAKLAKRNGIKNVLVTNGYQSIECINELAPYIDAANIDLKTAQNSFYSRLCGTRIQPILRNIRLWYKLGIWLEVTTLLIPGENDSDEEIKELAEFLYSIDPHIVWHMSAYYDAFRMHGKGRTPISTLTRAYEIGKKVGLEYIYLGNVSSEKHSTTFCHKCGETLVTRGHWGRGGRSKGIDSKKGTCKKCDARIFGVWTDEACITYQPKKDKLDPEWYKTTIEKSPMEFTDGMEEGDEEEVTKIMLLFATQTGVSEEYAKKMKTLGDVELQKNNLHKKFRIVVKDLEVYDETKMNEEKFVVVVTSTFFYGRIPRNGERFMNHLRKVNDPAALRGVHFAVMGIGSTGTRPEHLETYQVIAKEIDQKMAGLGGTRMVVMGEANKKKDFPESLDNWNGLFWETFLKNVTN